MHPSEVLFQGSQPPMSIPACDHYAGSEKLMHKSMALQQQMGPVFDITFDCEDGAAAGNDRGLGGSAAGRVGDPGLLLLHGNSAHADWYSFIGPLLKAGRRVVAMSFSGAGGSGWRTQYSVAQWADEALGVARQVGAANSPKLKVRFAPAWLSLIPAVWGDYWVVELDDNYQWAAVSEPGRQYLWILSRTPRMDPAIYADVLVRLTRKGLDVQKLEATRQDD